MAANFESDAEWVDVDREFGQPSHTPAPQPTPLPNPWPTPIPAPAPSPRYTPASEPPHDSPEKAPSTPMGPGTSNVGVVTGSVAGAMGVVLLGLLVYMLVLRRRLSKAKTSGRASQYQLRVEDVAHLSHLDETTNTYVNTTDLQKLVTSVRAKEKARERLPTPPRLSHETPAPYRPPVATPADNDECDRVVVRAPMPIPHPPATTAVPPPAAHAAQPAVEAVYSNLQETRTPPRPTPRKEAPKTAPPPPPTKEQSKDTSQPIRPAPAPPQSNKPPQVTEAPSTLQNSKPVPPSANLKPSKVTLVQHTSNTKPTPPTLPKPGRVNKGKALPPLKMVLQGSVDSDTCSTPDTALVHLTPEGTPTSTPTGESDSGKASISAKIAFLEGQMKTPRGAGPRPGGPRS